MVKRREDVATSETETFLSTDFEEAAMIQALQQLELRTPDAEFAQTSNRSTEATSGETLAIALQASLAEEAYIEAWTEEDTAFFAATSTGRAWNFVARVIALHNQLAEEATKNALCGFLEPVARDDIVALAERLLEAQAEFWNAGKPYQVDIGYQCMSEENMSRIKTDGLLSRVEREQRHIQATYHGSSYGEGVYITGNNPTDFLGSYGSVGLLVLRLRGKTGVFHSRHHTDSAGIDTFLDCPGPTAKIVVLR